MNIDERINQRRRQGDQTQLVTDYEALSPAAHIDEPTNRGRLLEQLLDYLEPVFDGSLPPNAYLYGPAGAGKSAVVTALFAHLSRRSIDPQSVIYTSTRVQPKRRIQFVYLDSRRATSEFEFYRELVNALVDDQLPERGIGTGTLRTRLRDQLAGSDTGLVLAVDHVGEPESTDPGVLVDRFAELPSNVSWLVVGRDEPAETVLTRYTGEQLGVERYRERALAEVLLRRAADGLRQSSIDRATVRRLADWAEGNAHDAMAALFLAASRAEGASQRTVEPADADAAVESVPRPCVSLGRVLALPANKQAVLRALVDLSETERETVRKATDAATASVDLSEGTVKRYIYELAEVGIVERVRSKSGTEQGRPPSRLEPRFPPAVFRRLYDMET
jgi:Cdc6-like AAA superfamily ATPase